MANSPFPIHSSQKGFTLLEILLATGIFMTTILVAIAIFGSATGSSATSEQMRQTAQSARFAFESISREARLAKGLVLLENDEQRMIVPPFQVNSNLTGSDEILIYQATRKGTDASGNNLYVVTRKTYALAGDSLTVKTQASNPNGRTVAQIAAEINSADFWNRNPANALAVPILANNHKAAKFEVIRFHPYPAFQASLDTLTVQPFIQLELAVANSGYNPASRDNKTIQTTLRTMIVPRDFVSKYEVAQPGLQGFVN